MFSGNTLPAIDAAIVFDCVGVLRLRAHIPHTGMCLIYLKRAVLNPIRQGWKRISSARTMTTDHALATLAAILVASASGMILTGRRAPAELQVVVTVAMVSVFVKMAYALVYGH
jgi:hypothetical protein